MALKRGFVGGWGMFGGQVGEWASCLLDVCAGINKNPQDMKRHLILLLLTFSLLAAHGQKVEILDDNRISITNLEKDYLKVFLHDRRTGEIVKSTYLYHNEEFEVRLPRKLTRHDVDNYEIVMVYDAASYHQRLRWIDQEFRRREEERQRMAIVEGIYRGLDQYFTGGFFSTLYDGVNIVDDALKGKPLDALVVDIGLQAAESKFIDEIDGKAAQGMAVAGLTIIKACQEADYPDLRQAAEEALQKLSSGKTEEFHPLEERVKFYVREEVFVHAAFPVYPKFKFKEAEPLLNSAFGEGPPPFDLQLNYWRRDKDAGYFPSLSVIRTPILYSNTADTVFTQGNARQYLSTSLGLGMMARYQGLTLRLGGYLGMMSETKFTYQLDGNKLLNLKAGGTDYFTTFNLSYRIGLTYDMGRVKLMGDFVGLHPHTEVNDAKGEKVKLVQGNFLSVGIGVALVRRWRGYGV